MATPFADVAFASNPRNSQRQPACVLIRQKEYAHDVAVITIDFERGVEKRYSRGQAVSITWGWLPSDVETFLGYVQFTKTIRDNNQPRQLKIYCIGASLPCNETHQRSFQRLLVGSIIGRIASSHRLSVLADPSSRYHRHIPQLGQSDWNLMVRLAKDIGFTLTCRQTTIRFQRRIIDTRPGRQPLFRFTSALTVPRGALYKITHKAGTDPFAERRTMQIDGLDDQGNIMTLVDNNGVESAVFTKFVPEQEVPLPLSSIQEGKELLSGLSGLNRFYVIANAELSGDQRVRPGTTIALQGADEADGYWWVGSVDHIITPTSYTMKTEIGRETVHSTSYVPAPMSGTGGGDFGNSDDPSMTGSPALFPDEPGVEFVADPDPVPSYAPLDDCQPIEVLSSDVVGNPVPLLADPLLSPARQQQRAQRPRPSRRRGLVQASSGDPAPQLNAWQSIPVTVRTTT